MNINTNDLWILLPRPVALFLHPRELQRLKVRVRNRIIINKQSLTLHLLSMTLLCFPPSRSSDCLQRRLYFLLGPLLRGIRPDGSVRISTTLAIFVLAGIAIVGLLAFDIFPIVGIVILCCRHNIDRSRHLAFLHRWLALLEFTLPDGRFRITMKDPRISLCRCL